MTVARILGPEGHEGAVRVEPLTDFPDRLPGLERVRLTWRGPLGSRARWAIVSEGRSKGRGFVLVFEGVSSREQARSLAGAEVEIPVSETRPLPPGRFYRFEIVGLRVYDEAGRELGTVSDILETGANDVYVVTAVSGGGSGDELLLPALKTVVLDIDPDAGRMVVRLPRTWESQ